MLIAAKILLTLTILGYALVTIKADFNKTHATNPKWTPHARFHVVWQILSYAGVGLVALYLVWIDGPRPLERLYLAAALSAAIYGGFFLSVLTSFGVTVGMAPRFRSATDHQRISSSPLGVDLELIGDVHVLGALEHLGIDHVGDDGLIIRGTGLRSAIRRDVRG